MACLLQREELEYHLEDDVEPYVAAAVSRWDNPEVTAMFADTLRRQKLLYALYATKMIFLTQDAFKLDLQAIANAKPEDFMHLQKYSTLGQAYAGSADKVQLVGYWILKLTNVDHHPDGRSCRSYMLSSTRFKNRTSDGTERCGQVS